MSPVPSDKPYSGNVRKCRRCGRDFDDSRMNAERECEQCEASIAAAMERSPDERDPAAGGPPVEPDTPPEEPTQE